MPGGSDLFQIGEQIRKAENLAGSGQCRFEVHLRLGVIGDHGSQIGAYQLILLRAQIDLLLIQKILRALHLAQCVAIEHALRGELRESLLHFGIRGIDSGAGSECIGKIVQRLKTLPDEFRKSWMPATLVCTD